MAFTCEGVSRKFKSKVFLEKWILVIENIHDVSQILVFLIFEPFLIDNKWLFFEIVCFFCWIPLLFGEFFFNFTQIYQKQSKKDYGYIIMLYQGQLAACSYNFCRIGLKEYILPSGRYCWIFRGLHQKTISLLVFINLVANLNFSLLISELMTPLIQRRNSFC